MSRIGRRTYGKTSDKLCSILCRIRQQNLCLVRDSLNPVHHSLAPCRISSHPLANASDQELGLPRYSGIREKQTNGFETARVSFARLEVWRPTLPDSSFHRPCH
jgi:hypothetical protein